MGFAQKSITGVSLAALLASAAQALPATPTQDRTPPTVPTERLPRDVFRKTTLNPDSCRWETRLIRRVTEVVRDENGKVVKENGKKKRETREEMLPGTDTMIIVEPDPACLLEKDKAARQQAATTIIISANAQLLGNPNAPVEETAQSARELLAIIIAANPEERAALELQMQQRGFDTLKLLRGEIMPAVQIYKNGNPQQQRTAQLDILAFDDKYPQLTELARRAVEQELQIAGIEGGIAGIRTRAAQSYGRSVGFCTDKWVRNPDNTWSTTCTIEPLDTPENSGPG